MNLDERTIQDAAPDALPSILGELARLTALATLRLTTPTVVPTVETEADAMLTAEEVGQFLGMTATAVLRSKALRPYRKVLGARPIRFSRLGIRRFMARK